ncbi:MAG TPA: AI-2E family transporter [Terriglobales bacterium]|nr:AI-2E family transporter [Terriglobales bacterium]
MDYGHVRTAGGALKRWFVAQCYDAAAVAAMWALGLAILRVPWWPLWAMMAGLFQFVPNVGGVLALMGPTLALTLQSLFGEQAHWMRLLYLLILYAVIVVIEGLILQPYLMKRSNRVPIWASIAAPLVLGSLFGLVGMSFVGVLISAPLLAVVYAFRAKRPPDQARLAP